MLIMKVCSKCKTRKPKTRFRKRQGTKDGFQYWCRDCENKANRRRYVKRPPRPKIVKTPLDLAEQRRNNKDRGLRHKYGIGIDEFERMYDDQGGRCAICEDKRYMYGKNGIYVDHCHETGKVRGLLCPRCNSLLGKFLEDPVIIKRALNYLDESK